MAMASPTRSGASSNMMNKRSPSRLQPQLVLALFLAVLLSTLLRCSPCEGRKLPSVEEHRSSSAVLNSEGGPALKAAAAAAVKGFSRAARSMGSVPSPGAGH
ncbi:hypothetical protein ZWY2020_044783 [Hordeum vulgare]|nr:hypothetical protein ZWY2020_044783 [Hordeum vulgare]